jgi:hypothetical protein
MGVGVWVRGEAAKKIFRGFKRALAPMSSGLKFLGMALTGVSVSPRHLWMPHPWVHSVVDAALMGVALVGVALVDSSCYGLGERVTRLVY